MHDELARCIAFLRRLDERRADRVEPCRCGKALFVEALPRVWYLNFLSVDLGADVETVELVDEAERVQGAAGLAHRKVCIDDGLGGRRDRDFRSLGWSVEQLVVMPHVRAGRSADMSSVVEVERELLEPVWAEGIREAPWGDDEEAVRQLVAAKGTTERAVETRFFAAFVSGGIASYCELYSDGEVGQIEAVLTRPKFRGRGLASAVVLRALAESRGAGNEVTFLLTGAGDWPQQLYRKLGFAPAGSIWHFLRTPTSGRPDGTQPGGPSA